MHAPSHEDIALCAEKLWQDYGQPAGRDDDIWLEAERRLIAAASQSASMTTSHKSGHTLGESHSEHALAEQAALQRKEAFAPQHAAKSAPHAKPAETGKPIWDKPHSR